MTRSVVRSRPSMRSGERAANCQATAAAEVTSMTESRPNPISAIDEAIVRLVAAPTTRRHLAATRVAMQHSQPFGESCRPGRRRDLLSNPCSIL
jgi:hypothetical protein